MTLLSSFFFLLLSFSFVLSFAEIKITDVISLEVYTPTSEYIGIVEIALFGELYPLTVNEVASSCSSEKLESVGLLYRGISGFLLQGYLETAGNYQGKAVEEITGSLTHTKGAVSLAQPGPGPSLTEANSKTFQNFFILLDDAPRLDTEHLIFGHVVRGFDLIEWIVSEYVTEKSDYFEKAPFIWKCSRQNFEENERQTPSSSLSYALALKGIPSQQSFAFESLLHILENQQLSNLELYDVMYSLVSLSEAKSMVPFEEIKARIVLIHEYTDRAEPLCDLAARYNEKKNLVQAHLFAKHCCQAPFPSSIHQELLSSGKHVEANHLSYFYNLTRFDHLGTYAYPAGEFQDGYDALKQALLYDSLNSRLHKNLEVYRKALLNH